MITLMKMFYFSVSAFIKNYSTPNLYGDVMEKVAAQLAEDAKRSELTMNNFRSVETSFSSTDIKSTEKCCHCNRKIKSQENIRSNKGMNCELLEWIRDSYSGKVSEKCCSHRIQKLMQKLAKPGGEENLKEKIEMFLKKVPSPLSECDEEHNELRIQLPDIIIKKLKKMYLKNNKRKPGTPIRIFRIEVPTSRRKNYRNRNYVKTVVESWLSKVPIKKKDFLNRLIKKGDVFDFVIKQLEPYMSNINPHDSKSTVKLFVRNLLEEIPLETKGLDKITCLNQLTTSLVDGLFKMDGFKDSSVRNKHTYDKIMKMLKHFVSQEVANILEKVYISISAKRLQLLEHELYNILKDVINLKCSKKSEIKNQIYNVLFNIGGFYEYQANYFTDSILSHLKEDFCNCKILSKDYPQIGAVYPEIYSVFESMRWINVGSSKIDLYLKQAIEHIKTWLKELSTQAPLFPNKDSKEEAVTNLAEDIIDRLKYLELNPASKGTDDNELQYLKYQIFKWINKIVGECNLQIIEHAPALMKRIQNISISSREDDVEDIPETSSFNQRDLESYHKCNQLYEQTVKWLLETTGNTKNFAVVSQMALELSQKIHSETTKSQFVDDIIEKEVNEWFQKIFKGEHIENASVDVLKKTLSYILVKDDDIFIVDPKQERSFVRMYEDMIDNWINTWLLDINDEALFKRKRNEYIHDLAVTLLSTKFKFRNSSLRDLNIEIKRIILKWLENVKIPLDIKVNLTDSCIHELVQTIQSSKLDNNEVMQRKRKHLGQLRYALQRWLTSLLPYRNAIVTEKRKLVQVVNNLALALNKNDANPLTEIYKHLQIIWHPNQDNNIIKQNANYVKTYLQELNLYNTNNRSNDEECANSKLHKARTFINSEDSWKQTHKLSSHVTVYGFTLSINPNKRVGSSENISMRSKTDAFVESDVVLYAMRLIKEIDEWLDGLQIPQVQDRGFREVVVNDLAGDIIDRHKYLELNPSSRGTDECEVELLKYQIFKWINKLVGEEHTETCQHAPDLMNRIRSIPVPVLTDFNVSRNVSEESKIYDNPGNSHSQPKSTVNNPMRTLGPKGLGGSMKEQRNSVSQDKRLSGPAALGIPNTPMRYEDAGNSSVGENDNVPQGMSLPETYAYFDKIIKDRIQEIPLECSTPDQEQLAKLARIGLYNAIWKTYFVFLDEPNISNDYCLFDLLFEERIDDMLDCLPQSQDMQFIREGWKSKLLNDLLLMLKYVHSITDSPRVRELILARVNRQMVKNIVTAESDKMQHRFVARTAEDFILCTRYKDEDPLRANVYRQRLMKRLEELAESVKSQHRIYFHQINSSQLCKIAMDILKSVPIPDKDELKEEAEELLLGEEIEQWYKDLPVKPSISSDNECVRKRLREILAKRLRSVEKQMDAFGDPSLELERNMKHEISKYLEKDAGLKEVNDLNINFMVEELANRIRTRREQHLLGYEGFEGDKPLSSTFIQTNPGEVMAPLVDIQKNAEFRHRVRASSLPSNGIAASGGQRFSLPTAGFTPCCEQMAGPSQGYAFTNHNIPSATNPQNSLLVGPPTTQEFASNRLGPDSAAFGITEAYGPRENAMLQGNVAPCPQHLNFRESNQGTHLSPPNMFRGQSTQGPSTQNTNISPTGATRSTARVATNTIIENETPGDEEVENEKEDHLRYRCHCMERPRRCRRRHYCDDMAGYTRRYLPMPYPMCHL